MSKCALITGASSGIGLELSKIFASEGYDLILVARNETKLNQLAAGLKQQHRRNIIVLAKDLSDPAAPEQIAETLQSQGVTIDVLVNNAGYGTHGEFVRSDPAEELRMIQVNLISLTHLTRLFLPGMVKRGHGRILNLGSTGSFAPTPGMAVYAATKAYVLSFSEALSEELKGSGVQVTALCPGVTLTGFQERAHVTNIRMLRGPAMSAREVAEAGYRSLMRGKTVVVPGFMNQLMAFFVRLTPRATVRQISRLMVQNES
jgi:short-subunit dehydrogenase